MVIPLMLRICAIIGKLIVYTAVIFTLDSPVTAANVRIEDYQNFWLWAGVKPPPALSNAKELYLLAGEVSNRGKPHIISQRSGIPHVGHAKVWIVYRVQTLDWNETITNEVLAHVQSWKANGNNLIGLQIDFDAGTKHLARYGIFLKQLRERLPKEFKLGVTGLLDWSANGDPRGLDGLVGIVDELVLQIYQGHHVIRGYENYLTRLDKLKVPFRIGLLQGGEWRAPSDLERNPNFRGYVIFLLNQ